VNICIRIKDINELGPVDVAAIMTRLSWPDSGSDSSIQKELDKRYVNIQPGPHPEMALAIIWFDDVLVGWVGTRLWPEKFKGSPIMAQTVECFVDAAWRRKGIARLGLQALIAAGRIRRDEPISVYAPNVIKLAEQCGCAIVLFCDP
jgi:hypothetical protein